MDQTRISYVSDIAGRFFIHWATREAPRSVQLLIIKIMV